MNLMKALFITEQPEYSMESHLEAWQYLLDHGHLSTLPGRYGRKAQELLDQGLISTGE